MGDRWCVCVRVRTRGKYAITDGVQSACLESREIVCLSSAPTHPPESFQSGASSRRLRPNEAEGKEGGK